MSADELRKAAKALRGWAEKATPGPWVARLGGTHAWVALFDDEDKIPEGESLPSFEQGGSATSYDAAYIATMHPGVGAALADWLQRTADEFGDTTPWDDPYLSPALRIALLVNGQTA